MPEIVRVAQNGFVVSEVAAITGLSEAMIRYLARMDFFQPAYGGRQGRRGKVRYYSYRDVVVARLVQRLRETGIELTRLKAAIRRLATDKRWAAEPDPAKRLRWLITDGQEIVLRSDDGFVDTFRRDGQRMFAFVVNLSDLADEVRARVPELQRASFTLHNRPLRFHPPEVRFQHPPQRRA